MFVLRNHFQYIHFGCSNLLVVITRLFRKTPFPVTTPRQLAVPNTDGCLSWILRLSVFQEYSVGQNSKEAVFLRKIFI